MPVGSPSNPGWTTGYTPTAAEWANEWGNKVDYPAPLTQGGTGATDGPTAFYNLQLRQAIGVSFSGTLKLLTQYWLQTSTGFLTLSLPALPNAKVGDWIQMVDIDFFAATAPVTIQAAGTDMISLYGAASTTQQININGGGCILVANTSGWSMLV